VLTREAGVADTSGTGRPVTDLEEFEEWATLKRHYQTTEAIARFKILKESRKDQEAERSILDAATMAMLDTRQDEE
jgi:hypothetical protein